MHAQGPNAVHPSNQRTITFRVWSSDSSAPARTALSRPSICAILLMMMVMMMMVVMMMMMMMELLMMMMMMMMMMQYLSCLVLGQLRAGQDGPLQALNLRHPLPQRPLHPQTLLQRGVHTPLHLDRRRHHNHHHHHHDA
jgi:hypothetical protein